MAGLQLTITKAGRAALINAEQNGTAPLTIASVGLTGTVFTPHEDLTELPDEFKRVTTISGKTVAPDTIHVTIRDESADTYNVFGMGYWLSNGVLLAVYGQTEPILQKSSQSMLLLSADIVLTTLNTASLTLGDTNFMNPPATETIQGVVELASTSESIQGIDKVRVVTPAGLSEVIKHHRLKSTDELYEGIGNLYFSVDRVRLTLLAGLTFVSNAAISAVDTVLSALGKLQAQITTLFETKANSHQPHFTGEARFEGNQPSSIATTKDFLGAIQVTGDGKNAAFMAFHRPHEHGVYFGVDTDNEFKIGGWSRGEVANKLLHDGNVQHYAPTLSGAGAVGNWPISITGSATTLNLANGGVSQFHWQGQGGQPTWCWGGNDPAHMYVYNPRNFSVAYAANAGHSQSSGSANVATRAHNGIVSITYGTSAPYKNGNNDTVQFTYLTFVFYNGANFSVATGNIHQGGWYDPRLAGIPTSGAFYS